MTTEISAYFDFLTQQVKDIISSYITDKTINKIISTALNYYLKKFTAFHDYYLQTISNQQYFLSSNNFFRTFKKQYALQGIDNNYLDRLEKKKLKIIQLINNRQLTTLYFSYFANAQFRRKNRIEGSFFTKLVHTFIPNDFCALDNPIKKYFGLDKESSYMAFLIISRAYKEWSNDNKKLIQKSRQKLKEGDKNKQFQGNRMADLKLLDLIFWHEANIEQ